jgi:hypothetical protein
MALARCEECNSQDGLKHRYLHAHTPILDIRIPCGARHCTRLASILLTDVEEAEYRCGLRRFSVLRHRDVRVT